MADAVIYWIFAACFWMLGALLAWRVMQFIHCLFFEDD